MVFNLNRICEKTGSVRWLKRMLKWWFLAMMDSEIHTLSLYLHQISFKSISQPWLS